MNNSLAGILELSLVFGALLAFLVWELIALRKEDARDKSPRKK